MNSPTYCAVLKIRAVETNDLGNILLQRKKSSFPFLQRWLQFWDELDGYLDEICLPQSLIFQFIISLQFINNFISLAYAPLPTGLKTQRAALRYGLSQRFRFGSIESLSWASTSANQRSRLRKFGFKTVLGRSRNTTLSLISFRCPTCCLVAPSTPIQIFG